MILFVVGITCSSLVGCSQGNKRAVVTRWFFCFVSSSLYVCICRPWTSYIWSTLHTYDDTNTNKNTFQLSIIQVPSHQAQHLSNEFIRVNKWRIIMHVCGRLFLCGVVLCTLLFGVFGVSASWGCGSRGRWKWRLQRILVHHIKWPSPSLPSAFCALELYGLKFECEFLCVLDWR